ncbi:MAG: hypothetical protein GC136_03850 [Alphaproteobacteria bacterium]|nr:hypothetical protein [Alphaproteobacteria bacterium]
MIRRLIATFTILFLAGPASAETAKAPAAMTAAPATLPPFDCAVVDNACMAKYMAELAKVIQEKDWHDKVLREAAKFMTAAGMWQESLNLIPQIYNEDTKAMTIRGIGMALADKNLQQPELIAAFEKLMQAATTITTEASNAVAVTYVAMGQAEAGLGDEALKTAALMTNAALRNKAYGEIAETHAKKAHFADIPKALAKIDDLSFKDKYAHRCVEVLTSSHHIEQAVETAKLISDPYKKASALGLVLERSEQKKDGAYVPETSTKTQSQ